MRVSVFIDGFNLYHALDGAGRQHLKWLNLRRLSLEFAPPPGQILGTVYYFSAFATWRPGAYARHRAFVAALKATGVEPVMGIFKERDLDAQQDRYDRALIISGDSDLAPAVRMVRELYPLKSVRIIAPYGRAYSMDLVRAAGGVANARRMKLIHVERSLLPAKVFEADGKLIATRPEKYRPPA